MNLGCRRCGCVLDGEYMIVSINHEKVGEKAHSVISSDSGGEFCLPCWKEMDLDRRVDTALSVGGGT